MTMDTKDDDKLILRVAPLLSFVLRPLAQLFGICDIKAEAEVADLICGGLNIRWVFRNKDNTRNINPLYAVRTSVWVFLRVCLLEMKDRRRERND